MIQEMEITVPRYSGDILFISVPNRVWRPRNSSSESLSRKQDMARLQCRGRRTDWEPGTVNCELLSHHGGTEDTEKTINPGAADFADWRRFLAGNRELLFNRG